MLNQRIINTATEAGAACTTDTVQILDGAPFQSIATYQLDGDANDLTTNYNGTASNVTYSTGKFGQAAVFNGSSSYIDTNYTLPAISTYSASLWFKTSATGINQCIFSDANSNGQDNSIRLSVVITNANTFGIALGNGSTSYYDGNVSAISYLNNAWHNLVITYSGTTIKLYINNSLIVTYTSTVSAGTLGTQTLKIGRLGDYSGFYFNGSIDQVRIYDKALSAADVTTLYNETVATASTNITLEAPSLVAYYKMNDATDETGSYDGTPTNVNFNVAGKFGNAGEFNGSSSVIVVPNNMLNTSGHSVSMWFNLDDTNGIQTVVEFDYENRILFRAVSTDSNLAYVGNSGYFNHGIAFSAGQWYHLVITFSAGNPFKIYVDGVLSYTGGNTNILAQSNDNILGSSNSSGSNGVDGKIDQVRIFDREITSSEVAKLYNEVHCQPTIVPTEHFEPVLYTGNGSSQSISTLDFQPDTIWIKSRSETGHHSLFDSVRGIYQYLTPNQTGAEIDRTSNSAGVTSFDSNGFSVNDPGGSGENYYVNQNNVTYAAWNWKAGGADVQNTDGTITSQVSANVDAGFSIVKWTAESTVGTVGHGLSTTPELIIFKRLDTSQDWYVETDSIDGSYDYLVLNSTAAKVDGSGAWSTRADSTTITSFTGTANADYIAYCFHSVDGMSRIGSYVGTGTSGNAIVTGFRPAFVMVKASNGNTNWVIVDNKRGYGNNLSANTSLAEYLTVNGQGQEIEFLSNGFEVNTYSSWTNGNNTNYIYMAFAEENVEPQPELANSFNTVTYTGNGGTQAVTGVGFQPDLVWIKERNNPIDHLLFDAVRGAGVYQRSNLASNEPLPQLATLSSFDSNGFSVGTDGGVNGNNDTYVAWCWKASNESTINQEGSVTSIVSANPAAGFSVVRHTGTGSAATVGHGLSSTPELIIRKDRDAATDWWVYASVSPYFGYLNHTDAFQSANNAAYSYNQTVPTSTIFNVGNTYSGNVNNNDYIAYCFHSVDGYQKVGSYSGSGGAGNAQDVGFAPSFVMVKRTDSASGWLIIDSVRGNGHELYPHSSLAELSSAEGGTYDRLSLTSTGFEFKGTAFNESGSSWIYLAIKAN